MTTPARLGATAIRAALDRHGARPRKRFGQNFVIDPNTIDKFMRVADLNPEDRVLEVGAGAGSLTAMLVDSVAHVIALEVDGALIPVLGDTVGARSNLEVINADVMAIDLASVHANKLVGNLPYNIAAQIVIETLMKAPQIEVITVMVQREVGERLASPPGTKTYGLPSLISAFYADVVLAAAVSRRAFWPVPNVDSVIVRLERRPARPEDPDRFIELARAAFSQRRKMVSNTLSPVFGSTEAATAACRAAGVDPSSRPESLGVPEFAALAAQSR